MILLGIDPGSLCGWAYQEGGKIAASGTWEITPGPTSHYKTRWLNLYDKLLGLDSTHKIEAIVYEDVKRHAGTIAAHVYGGIEAIIQMYCEMKEIDAYSIGVSTVSKYVRTYDLVPEKLSDETLKRIGKTKRKSFALARARWPDQKIYDDNQSDAIWILNAFISGAKSEKRV